MQINGYTFYGQNTQCQRALIDAVNAQFPSPIKEIEGGMCYMLSMQFLIDYLSPPLQNPAPSPRQVFNRLTSGNDQYAYLKQIAGNFRAYISNGLNLRTVEDQTTTYISLLSNNHHTAHLLCSFKGSSLPNNSLTIANRGQGHLAILFFENSEGETCGHVVSVVWDGTNYSLYDPNYGIYGANSTDEIYGAVLPMIYTPKNPSGITESIYAVT